MNKKNIAIIINSLEVGGLERHIELLSKKLKKTNSNITIICLKKAGRITLNLSEEGFSVYSNLVRSKFSIFPLFKLIRIINQNNLRYILAPSNPNVVIYLWILKFFKDLKVTIAVHKWNRPGKTTALSFIEKLILPRLDRVISLGNKHKDLLAGEGIPIEKISVIYNGIDHEYFTNFSKNNDDNLLGDFSNHIKVGIFARLSQEKNHIVLFEAFQHIFDSLNLKNIVLIVAGEGPLKNSLVNQSKQLNINNNILFIGEVENVASIMNQCDIIVLSSLKEVLPMCIIEAMVLSKAIISTDVGCVSEMLDNNKSGLIIKPNSVEEMKSALLRFLQDEKFRITCGQNASIVAKNKFDADKMAQNYLECLS